MDLPTLQTNFNAGELDPLLHSRVDIEQYFQGATYIRNGLVVPQGGVKRRPGLEFIADLGSTSSANAEFARAVPFIYGVDGSEYLFVFTDNKLQIFEDDAVVFTTVVAGEKYAEADLEHITWTQNDEILITFHEDSFPRRYVRGATSASWTIEDLPIFAQWMPQHHFEDTVGANVDHVHELAFYNFANLDRFTLFVNGHETPPIVANEINATMKANLEAGIQAIRGIGSVTANWQSGLIVGAEHWQIVFDGANLNSGRPFTVTEGNPNIDDQAQDNLISDLEVTKGSLAVEDSWSVARGFPRCGTFFQGRLWMGGSTERPQTLWGSNSSNIYNFSLELDDDDFAIEVTINTENLASIRQLFVGRHLQIFTSEGEYYVPESDAKVVTPQNIVVRRTTSRGISKGTQVFDVDGATFFLDAEEKSLRRFVFDDAQQSYTSENLGLLSSHIFKETPEAGTGGSATGVPHEDIAYRKSTTTDEADYILFINGDGNLAVYCTLFSQNVSAWTVQHTRGVFVAAAVLGNQMYFIVDRGMTITADGTPGGRQDLYLEKFNADRLFDSSLTGTGVASSATLAHLDGLEVDTEMSVLYGDGMVGAVIDGNVMDEDKTVNKMTAGGVFTFDYDSVSTWEVGLWFGAPGMEFNSAAFLITDSKQDEVLVRTLPIESSDFGTLIGRLMRIREVTARLNATKHLTLKSSAGGNQREILFRELPTVLGNPAPEFTGDQRVKGMLGYSLAPTLDFIQTTSLEMHLMGVALRASI